MEIVRWPFLHLIEMYSERDVVLGILNMAALGLLDPAGPEESAAEHSCWISGCDFSTISEQEPALADIFQA